MAKAPDRGQEIPSPKRPYHRRSLSPIYLDRADEAPETAASRLRARPLPRPSRHRRIVFGWYGGKFNHLDWLLPLLPEAHHYCEPYAGSGAVLLNRAPCPIETYNDIDGDVVTFFRVLRDRPEDLIRAIALTPFSREEFYDAIHGDSESCGDLECARRFYVRARQARTGLAQTATLGRWANCKETSRGGMSGTISRWYGGVEALSDVANRLLRVQIENRPALDLIRVYDGPTTLFYCDPPYLHQTRGDRHAYGFEMDETQHRELASALGDCRGKAAVSGYRCRVMDLIFQGWHRFDAPEKHCHSNKKPGQESLWMNY